TFGRVWTAAADRQAIDMWDPLTGKLTEISLAHSGNITALAVDRGSVLWVGTDTGQTFAVRGAGTTTATVQSGLVGRAGGAFAFGENGALYFVNRTATSVSYGPVGGGAVKIAPGGASEPMFDILGRAWQGDFSAQGFYVTIPAGRP